MGLDVTYRLCSVPKSDLGTDLCNTVTRVTGQKKKKGKCLLMKFGAEATFQTLINAEEDRHVIHLELQNVANCKIKLSNVIVESTRSCTEKMLRILATTKVLIS